MEIICALSDYDIKSELLNDCEGRVFTVNQLGTLRKMIEKASVSLDDTDALTAVELFPAWSDSATYSQGDRVRYEDTLYKCLTAHTSQSTWTPPDSPSLWVRVDDPHIEWPAWVQPTGATDAYAKGAKVTHVEKHWISDVDGNVWEPGAVGTESLWTEVTS